jgi:two-component system, OmpR family, response regulator PrrA
VAAGLPVIVVSSRKTQIDLLRAFEAGADDYLPRPVGYLELRARLRAVLRRSQHTPENDGPLTIGPLTIDPATYTVTLHGEQVNLRRMEYELLLAPGRRSKARVSQRRAAARRMGLPLRSPGRPPLPLATCI